MDKTKDDLDMHDFLEAADLASPTLGLQPGQLTMIAGGGWIPIAQALTQTPDARVALFLADTTREAFFKRLLFGMAKVEADAVRKGALSDE
jgi:hypothetical protein